MTEALDSLPKELALAVLVHLHPSNVAELLLVSYRIRSLFMLAPEEYRIALANVSWKGLNAETILAIFHGGSRLAFAFWLAGKLDSVELTEMLIAGNKGLRSAESRTAMNGACRVGSAKVVEYLLSVSAADLRNERYKPLDQTPLRECAKYGHLNVMRVLFAPVNGVTPYVATEVEPGMGLTPLQAAARGRNTIIAETVLARSAPVDVMSFEHGGSPIHVAVRNQDLAMVRLLLSYGSSLDEPDPDGFRPLQRAVATNNVKLVKLLIELGANPDPREDDGLTLLFDPNRYTTLHRAVAKDNAKVVKLLVKAGAAPAARDKDGLTVLHYAVALGRLTMVKLLCPFDVVPSEAYKELKEHGGWVLCVVRGWFTGGLSQTAEEIVAVLKQYGALPARSMGRERVPTNS
ncbi:hypothetical protein HDU96_001481 [Phlyctochytrium bullatum]|nr:hypothetical protein HDU96_001481 [Phlyctochytrium bullatum]